VDSSDGRRNARSCGLLRLGGHRDCGSARATPAGTASASTESKTWAGASATTGDTRDTASAGTTTTAVTFCRKDHLQHSVGVLEEVLELLALRTQHFCCKLRSYFDSCHGRIFCHITDLVDLDAGFTG